MNTDKIIAESIAKEYAPRDNSKIVALKKLDNRAKLPAIIFAYSFGIISSLVVGIGMVARSEVALMVAQKGIDAGMIDPVILPAIVMSVIACALLTPVLLKVTISKGPELA